MAKKEVNSEDSLCDVAVLIRSIQKTEGNPDCFRRPAGNCERLDCLWRKYCLNPPQKHFSVNLPVKSKKD